MLGSSVIHFTKYLFGFATAKTQTTVAEQEVIYRYASGTRRLVEIGVFQGFTTRRLAEAMHPEGTLFAIDPFFRGRFGICWDKWVARREVARVGARERVHFIEALSHEARISGEFDFIFIDGDHSLEGISRDWTDWSVRLNENGAILLHDTRVPAHDSNVAGLGSFRYFQSHIAHDPAFAVVEQVDSLSVLKRR